MTYEIYVDTGGTFTDCLGKDPEGNWMPTGRYETTSSNNIFGTLVSLP